MALAQTAEDGLRFGQRLHATGARMTGMGTAGYGGFGDYGALYGNPAGLGLVRHSSFSGNLHVVQAAESANSSTQGFASRGVNDYEISSANVGNLAALYKAPTRQGSLVFGAAINQVGSFDRELRFEGINDISTITTSFLPLAGEYTLGEEGQLESLDDFVFPAFNAGFVEYFPEFLDENPEAYPFLQAVVPGTSITQSGRVAEAGRVYEASLGGAIEVARGTFAGVSLNFVSGSYEFRSRFEEVDDLDLNTAADYSVYSDGNLLEGFESLSYRQRLDSDLTGFNLRLGISTEISSNLRAGVAIESPTTLRVDESYGTSFETFFDDGSILAYGDHADDVGSGIFEYRVRTPWRLGVGVSWEIGGFTILVDTEVMDWSQMMFSASSDGGYFEDLNDQIGEEYGAVVNVSGGAEINLGRVLLRAGAALQRDPLGVDLFTSSGSPLNRDQQLYSFGAGYHLSPKFRLDLGLTVAEFEGTYLPYPVDAYGTRQAYGPQIDETVERFQFVLGATYGF